MAVAAIILVSTDAEVVATTRRLVASMGHRLRVAGSLEQASKALSEGGLDALIVQTDAAGTGVRERLSEGFLFWRDLPVIALAKKGSIQDAVLAVRAGARDYVSGRDGATLRSAINRVLSASGSEGTDGDSRYGEQWPFGVFITDDHRVIAAFETVTAVGDSRASVLIEGERGTGKTLFGRLLHEHSPRRLGPFLEVHCGALSESLIEGELFGQVRRSFRSGYYERTGKFELADGGTVLLDDVSSASRSLQARLLRVVQSGEFERVGSTETIRTDVRILAAANRPLAEKVTSGSFREDLYHRLHSLRVVIPPLRERVGDIPLLVRHFVRIFADEYGRSVTEVTAEAMDRLVHYPWPGNVRELRNVLEHGVILAAEDAIGVESLPHRVCDVGSAAQRAAEHVEASPLKEAMREPERRYILRALRMTRGNKLQAARELRISRSTLYKKIKEHGLDGDRVASDGVVGAGTGRGFEGRWFG